MKDLEIIIKNILEKFPETRDDDMKLYRMYCIYCVEMNDASTFERIFTDKEFRINNKVSVFESVSRCRRKLQEVEKKKRLELGNKEEEKIQSSGETQFYRSEKERDMVEYSQTTIFDEG